MSNNIYITYNIDIDQSLDSWLLTGNTVSGSTVLGTVNDEGLDIITNNIPRITIENDGEIGIGKNPQSGVTIDISGQLNSDLFSHPQLITKNMFTPPNSNSFLVAPVSIDDGYVISVGENSFLIIL